MHLLPTLYSLRNLPLLLLMLSACSHYSNWEVSQIYSQNQAYTSKRLTFQDPSFKDMTLEILVYPKHTKCYVNFLDPLPKPDTSQICITITTDDQTIEGKAHYLKGGQKVLLSDDCAKKLLQLLQEEKELTIHFEENYLTVLPDNFTELFEKKQSKIAQLISSFF